MKLMASAGLAFDYVHLQYLAEGDLRIDSHRARSRRRGDVARRASAAHLAARHTGAEDHAGAINTPSRECKGVASLLHDELKLAFVSLLADGVFHGDRHGVSPGLEILIAGRCRIRRRHTAWGKTTRFARWPVRGCVQMVLPFSSTSEPRSSHPPYCSSPYLKPVMSNFMNMLSPA